MPEKILVNRFSLDDPDWDLLDCDLPEGLDATEPKEEQERWLAETATPNTLR
jgi:hypothetical protein